MPCQRHILPALSLTAALLCMLSLGMLPLDVIAQPTATPQANPSVEQAKARVRAAERAYAVARDQVLELRDERDRLSRHASEAERRKVRTTTGWSRRADDYATEDLRDYRADLNRVRREEARASIRLEDAKRQLAAAKQALTIAEQQARGK